MPADPVAVTRDLIRCPSVTPAEGGALAFLQSVLREAGFTVHRMTFSEPGTDDVENLYARLGTQGPHLMFAGHTDVVPPGDESAWTHPPFAGDVDRTTAVRPRRGRHEGRHRLRSRRRARSLAQYAGQVRADGKGSISFLITGDEESIAVNGTPKLLQWAAERGEKFDHCILGEPSSQRELGDTIKIGRRGSLNGTSDREPASRATSPIRSAPTIRSAASSG